jgi:CheY-like chemotaxis protein
VRPVLANAARLGQVFLNLLLNAVQALPEERTDRNEIRLIIRPAPDDKVVIEVHDNGPGIPPHIRGRIFEPFFTTKPVGVGTGLGLAICHGIVTGLSGTLTLDSELGKGTVFRVELPTTEIAEDEAPPQSSPRNGIKSAPIVPVGPSGRILVIDDEPIVCLTMERLLSPEAHVTALTSAKEALRRLVAGERFDVILCDLMMPEMDAPALHAQVTAFAPEQAQKMIFVTGGAFTTRTSEFLDNVPNARLPKPFDLELLRSLIRARLGKA